MNAMKYQYDHFSQLAGSFSPLPKYEVQYRWLMNKPDRIKAILLTLFNLGFELSFLLWLFTPDHIHFDNTTLDVKLGLAIILAGIVIVESFRLINMVTLCLSAILAKDPIPVEPEAGTRVAFTTTIVPGKEPIEIVGKTLLAMKRVRHNGPLDVWLLDEGNDPYIKLVCDAIGVNHFSRKDNSLWNTDSGSFKRKTKHGNHNAWLAEHGSKYDYVLSVDPDHIPLPNFAERLLGYFRDQDVAFVVGPQVYGNYDNVVTKGAESQAYIFQAAIQRGGNAYSSPMFVGTNHAYRVKAWDTIDGFQDSITEDMLTSLTIHATKNPDTGKHWKSIYTPDVVAVGEGPSSWTDFFSQQLRWSRGSMEVLLCNFAKLLGKLPLKSRLHYILMISYYPTAAISWVVGIAVSMLYLVLGQAGIDTASDVWLALYTDLLAVQIILYGWLRKYNVSPHEKRGTLGFSGMIFSMFCGPFYVVALVATLLRKQVKFVVTPKGDSASPDTLQTFRLHLGWAVLIVAFLIYSFWTGHTYIGVKIWSLLTLVVCLAPVAMWQAAHFGETKLRIRNRFATLMTRRKFEGVKSWLSV